jgi:hypothetical protein
MDVNAGEIAPGFDRLNQLITEELQYLYGPGVVTDQLEVGVLAFGKSSSMIRKYIFFFLIAVHEYSNFMIHCRSKAVTSGSTLTNSLSRCSREFN